MRRRKRILALVGALLLASAAMAEPRPISIQLEEPRFAGLADAITEQLVLLLGPEGERWTMASDEPVSGHAIFVSIGAGLGSARAEDRIRVDPVGWLAPGPGVVSLGDSERRLQQDFDQLRQLLEALGVEPQELIVPLDDWLAPTRPKVEAAARAAGFEPRFVAGTNLPEPYGGTDAEVAAGGSAGQVVFVPPGSSVDAEALAAASISADMPSFSARGRPDIEAGLLAGSTFDARQRLARLTALEVAARLRARPGPVEDQEVDPSGSIAAESIEAGSTGAGSIAAGAIGAGPAASRLAINTATAAALDLELPWRLALRSDLISADMEASAGIGLTLESARREVVANNLALRAEELRTAASEQDIELALSRLRPRSSLGANASTRDAESARAAFGAQPERSMTAVGEASWVLFSESARSAIDGTRRLQAARRLEFRALRLDLELEAGAAVLDVLTARAGEAIERQAIELSHAELDAAQSRRRAGAGGRADVARLEARVARERQSLVTAYGDRRAAELALLRLLGRPIDGAIGIDVIEEDPETALPLESVVAKGSSFDALSAELLERGLRRAPEIEAAGEVVAARERQLLAARRAFYLPDIAASASASTRLAEGGDGTSTPFAGSTLSVDTGFPAPPDSQWTLGLSARWSLFTGGERQARRTRAALALEAAETLAMEAERRVEERIRRALALLETSYEAAFQAREATHAAEVAYDVVAAGYRQGTLSLTDLLDAKTALRSARLSSAASRYGARARWLEVQRASGGFFTIEELAAPRGPTRHTESSAPESSKKRDLAEDLQ